MIVIDIDNVAQVNVVPAQTDFERWATLALKDLPDAEISIRIVSKEESANLNQTYRHKIGPTNILSFPADIPEIVQSPLLGDLIICAAIIEEEAKAQQKPLLAHWAHIVIHGILHLLGYDHQGDNDATVMEALEINLLRQLGYDDPYQRNEE